MGHEAILYGRVVGASWRAGERFTWTHDLNRETLAQVPKDDDWPWVVQGIFALPAPYPQGTYHRQVIHFGLSRGKPELWACAVLRVIGWVNFLDGSSETPTGSVW